MPSIFDCPKCYLSDSTGRRISPCSENAIQYTVISCQKVYPQQALPSDETVFLHQVAVLIEGYLVVYLNEVRISDPIPFSKIQTIFLYVPNCDGLIFTVRTFDCHADPIFSEDKTTYQLAVTINLDSYARSTGETDIIVPVVNFPLNSAENKLLAQLETEDIWISVIQVFDRIAFSTEINLTFTRNLLKAQVSQYNTVSDGIKKIYTNADEIAEYGSGGILNPDDITYSSLFINGTLQPSVNYTIAPGLMTLATGNAPIQNAPILIRFIILKDKNGNLLKGEIYQYNTVSNGIKKDYTNADEILEYGDQGILNPNSVSFYNVYINGVLQPKTNYTLAEGLLSLKTPSAPLAGAPIIVEFITVNDISGNLLKAAVTQYNTLGENKRVYTNQDELYVYGHDGIPDPESASYQNLGVNGVIQPDVNYSVSPGLLTLNTEDTPLEGVPIYLQSVFFYSQEY